MRKILGLAFVAFSLTTTASALADSKSAAEFVLKTCLAAVERFAKVEVPCTYPPKDLKFVMPHTDWEAVRRGERYSVTTWINERAGNIPTCIANFHETKNINRDDFFAAISATLELKLESEQTNPRMRTEDYNVTSGSGNFLLRLISHLDGSMAVSLIISRQAASHPPSDSCFWLRRRLS